MSEVIFGGKPKKAWSASDTTIPISTLRSQGISYLWASRLDFGNLIYAMRIVHILIEAEKGLTAHAGNSYTARSYDQSARSSARIERRFPKPMPKTHNPPQNKALTQKDKIDLAENLALLLQEYPDLAHLANVWPSLPDNTKQEIIDLVKTDDKGGDGLSE